MPSFVLALCHPGAERALKEEAAAAGLRPAFQAPGLVTVKSDADLQPDFTFPSGLSRFQAPQCVRLEGPAPTDGCVHTVDLVAETSEGRAPNPGELVRTVVTGPLVGGKSARFVTTHVHGPWRSPFPANRVPLVLPASAPSRAWLKIEEAIARFGLDMQRGQRVLEIGSAPGGASRAMFDRGLHVVGVDPNEMDPRVLGERHFEHMRVASTQLEPSIIQGEFQSIVLDVNVPPGTALRGALPFVELHARSLLGIVFTLKLGKFEMAAELTSWCYRIQERLPRFVLHACSLWSNQQELCVVAIRR